LVCVALSGPVSVVMKRYDLRAPVDTEVPHHDSGVNLESSLRLIGWTLCQHRRWAKGKIAVLADDAPMYDVLRLLARNQRREK